MWDFVCTLWEWSLYFPQPSGSHQSKPCWPSEPDVLGAHFPGVGPLDWGAWCGSQTPLSLGRTSAIIIILPFVVCLPEVVGLDCTVHLPLLTHLIVVPSLYLWLWKIFSISLQVVLIHSSVNRCNFGVLVEGGELRGFPTLPSQPHLYAFQI